MATETDVTTSDESTLYTWITGIIAGVISAVVTGLVIQFGFDPTVLADGIPSGFGLSGLAAGWAVFLGIGALLGLVYTALAVTDQVGPYAVRPGSGATVGLLYGLVVWVVAVIVVPVWTGAGTGQIGGYAVNLHGVLSFALIGVLIGLIYGVSPYTH